MVRFFHIVSHQIFNLAENSIACNRGTIDLRLEPKNSENSSHFSERKNIASFMAALTLDRSDSFKFCQKTMNTFIPSKQMKYDSIAQKSHLLVKKD